MVPAIYTADKEIPWRELLLPWRIARQLHRRGELIVQFAKRDVLSRYRGSYLGMFWSLLRPLSMLALYTVVFGYIFQSKLGDHASESKLDFTLALFCGLILFDFLAECLARAPILVLSNPNYVTKVVFPLEILPVMAIGAALVQLIISCIPLLIALAFVHGSIPSTAFYLPLILMPLVFLCLGLTWLLASLGVFIRDINAVMPVILTIVMYASAIFYSIKKVPTNLLPIVLYNPLAVAIDEARNAVLWGVAPAWGQYGMMLGASFIVMILGYAFFMRTKSAFADVL
ncbi:MAG TPA: ABC transporter permease [Verrucomicrobiae bacterium]|nr:ABC transporter permease [Verrucomicrobiae bacterium]